MLWVALLIVLYAYFETQGIKVCQDRISVHGLPAAFDGFSIVHISDLHSSGFGPREKRLCRLLRGVHADLFIFTGDYKRRKTTSELKVEKALREIARPIKSRLGMLGVLGNKDSWQTAKIVERAGIQLLSGRARRLVVGNDSVWMAGIDGLSLRRATRALISVTSQIPDGRFKVLLSHGPDVARLARALGYSLIFCGDTHGGQVRLPLIGALYVKSEVSRRYCRGIIREGSTVLCIHSGIGTCAFPLRFLCPPELRLLTLVPERDSRSRGRPKETQDRRTGRNRRWARAAPRAAGPATTAEKGKP